MPHHSDDAQRSDDREDELVAVSQRLREIELTIYRSSTERPRWMTLAEFADIVDRSARTVRRWCRNRRIYAEKTACGRGGHGEWRISDDEVRRYQRYGLLPPRSHETTSTDWTPVTTNKEIS